MRKHKINQEYFHCINTEEKAYWLGFLYADGCVSKDKKYIYLDLHISDINHIKKFLKATDSDYPIKIHGEKSQYARVNIGSMKMAEMLISLGCIPQKSLKLKFPERKILPENLIKHFVRGYFDGDGCLSLVRGKRKSRSKKEENKNKILPHIFWEFYILGNKEFLEGIRDNLSLPEYKIIHANKKHNIYKLYAGGSKKVKKFMDSIYSEASIFLDRKYEKYLELCAFIK